MQSFEQLSAAFQKEFSSRHFPDEPRTLYDPAEYFLGIGGKRVRPVLCLMANELFGEIGPDAFHVAAAIELFHNFSLIHDDIMDKAPLRRGMETLHQKYGESTALLAGDVMLVHTYECINKIDVVHLKEILFHFNKCARQVCEGQQLDMDFESRAAVNFMEYIQMIALKTSVLLASSLSMGAVLGGATIADQQHLYEFGKNLGIAFQVQDDFLDAFGDPQKFGKQIGGDIRSNKKTFLLIRALELAGPEQAAELQQLMNGADEQKVVKVLRIFRDCGVDSWASDLKEKYMQLADEHLRAVAVEDDRKEPLRQLMSFLLQRDH